MMDVLLALAVSSASFLIKAIIVVAAILIVMAFAMKNKDTDSISVKDLNKKFKNYKNLMMAALLDKKKLKKELKLQSKADKSLATEDKPTTYVIHFKGDVKASAVDSLRESVTAILTVAKESDEVVLCLESPGGMVHGYGLAASQLQRLKEARLRLTVCVDKVAASGGYMMACLADQIIAAPFAILGSVGVVANVPNFNRKLKNNDVDYYQITAGKYKRTISILGEITQDGLEKFKEELEETHVLFKNHVKKFRPQIDIEKIATGEHWYGEQSLELKLIDKLGTSDDYLLTQSATRQLKEVEYKIKKGLKDKLSDGLVGIYERTLDFMMDRNQSFFH
ncbi:MAG: protease SohB [Bdellovibrionales bacterium]|nr:protease SohB [Bdellovibrionales bacterium]